MIKGDYYKLVGDHAGVLWAGTRWERFDCEACVRQLGLARRRLQGPMSAKASDALHGKVMHRHDVNVHQAYMRAAAAAQRPVAENARPSEGVYYCLRYPAGWQAFAYQFDEFPEADHTHVWEAYCAPVLAKHWAPRLKVSEPRLAAELAGVPYGLPRGRIAAGMHAGARHNSYVVYHGNDTPASISRSTIMRLFGLPANTPWEFDNHERCVRHDYVAIRRILKLSETWKAAND